jgi:hypothetical protein
VNSLNDFVVKRFSTTLCSISTYIRMALFDDTIFLLQIMSDFPFKPFASVALSEKPFVDSVAVERRLQQGFVF